MFGLTSCNDMLDKDPYTFTNDNFWQRESNVECYANRFYNDFTGYGNGGGSGIFYYPSLNDDQIDGTFRNWNYDSYKVTNNSWDNGYSYIDRANIMIAGIEKVTSMSDDVKKHWTGVARLMRARQYYELVRKFGDVPLIKKHLDPVDVDEIFSQRINRDEVMDFVLEDLKYAAEHMLNKKATEWSRSLAQSIKSEICLYEGTYCKYRKEADGQKAPNLERSKKFLEEAKKAAKAVMDAGYSLTEKYGEIYNAISLAKNPEVIFYKHYAQDAFAHGLIAYTMSSTTIKGMTRDAFDSFLFVDGKPKGVTSENDTDCSEVVEDGNVNIQNLLDVRDPRMSLQTDPYIYFAGCEWGNRFPDRTDNMNMMSASGYGVKKFDCDAGMPVGYRGQIGKNFTDAPLYWLAEIYLNYAEACAELGTCTQNDLDISVNKLRERVNMPKMNLNPVADPANKSGVSNLIWEVRRERRVEMMYDKNHRFWDLVRWHELDRLDTDEHPEVITGANVSAIKDVLDSEKTKVTADGYIDGTLGGKVSRKYDSKYYFYPIPSKQISLMQDKGYKQNPGW